MAIRRINSNQAPASQNVALPLFRRKDEIILAEDIGQIAGKVIQLGNEGSRTPMIWAKFLNGLETGDTVTATLENQIGNGWVIKLNDYQQEAQENDSITFLIIWQ